MLMWGGLVIAILRVRCVTVLGMNPWRAVKKLHGLTGGNLRDKVPCSIDLFNVWACVWARTYALAVCDARLGGPLQVLFNVILARSRWLCAQPRASRGHQCRHLTKRLGNIHSPSGRARPTILHILQREP